MESEDPAVESFFSHDQVSETKAASPTKRNGLTLLIINNTPQIEFFKGISKPFLFQIVMAKITNAMNGFLLF